MAETMPVGMLQMGSMPITREILGVNRMVGAPVDAHVVHMVVERRTDQVDNNQHQQ